MARFYAISVEPTLFAETALVRRWGRIGTSGTTDDRTPPVAGHRRDRAPQMDRPQAPSRLHRERLNPTAIARTKKNRTPISQDRSPGQGFGRSSRFAGLSRPAFAPLPRRPPCERGGSFRNKPVPEDEPMRNAIRPCAKTRPLSGTDRQDHRRARGGNGALATTLGQDRRRRRDCTGECRHRPSTIAASTSSSSACRRSP